MNNHFNNKTQSNLKTLFYIDKTLWKNSVIKNAFHLYVIHFANYLLPLFIIPYLLRVLGPKGYGMVAFSQSLILYFTIFIDYGFLLSATRKISVNRDNLLAINKIIWNTWAAKSCLFIIGFIILIILIFIVPKLNDMFILLVIIYLSNLGNVLFPQWLFQGMEKMVNIAIINLIMRFLVMIGIFTYIHEPNDYLIYASINSMGMIGSGIAGVVVAFKMFKLHPIYPTWKGIQKELIDGGALFLSQASISLYTVGNAFILGILTNHLVVGYYSAAEKIVKILTGFIGPLSQAAYPRFSKMASESKWYTLYYGKKMLLLMSSIGFILSVFLLLGAPVIVKFLLGKEYEVSIKVIRILALLPFLISGSNVLGVQIMYSFKLEREVIKIVLIAGLINLSLAVILAPLWSAAGMAVAVVISEFFVTIGFFLYLHKNNLNPITSIYV